ncbi:unnamed protein product [Phaedon cochleariae]|uniref:BolA-like protein 3 n=1 Tax=Phaedon cochleariae TaxID=80249 RepID=A0A9P0GPC6_PHACE|nr:unnamed protein product [Phaedon cochleariae]
MYNTLPRIIPKYCRVGLFSSHLYSSRKISSNNGPITENFILTRLREKFPTAGNINVEDTSGGCGAMFNVVIESPEFHGLSVMKQHRKVYDALKDQIKQIHGIHLETKAPKL